MMNCYEVTRLMSEAQERTLTLKERLALRFHTAMCSACRRFGCHLETIRQAMQRYASGADNDS